MVKINNTDITDSLVKEAGIQTSRETPPTELAEKIIPTLPIQKPLPRIRKLIDLSANSNNKTFTVPDGKMWKVLYGIVDYTADANVGNRRVRIQYEDSDGTLMWFNLATGTFAASATTFYSFSTGFADSSAAISTSNFLLGIPPESWLTAGQVLRIDDVSDISALDDFEVTFTVEEYSYGSI